MNLIRLIKIEIGKLKRSKIGLILLIPVLLVWISGIMNADMNFEMQAEGISPENNFFIQSFLGYVWFMLPSSLVVITVLMTQTERNSQDAVPASFRRCAVLIEVLHDSSGNGDGDRIYHSRIFSGGMDRIPEMGV